MVRFETEAEREGGAAVGSRLPRAVLMLPGQGAQQDRMGTFLYDRDVTFTEVVDRVFHLMGNSGPLLRAEWLSGTSSVPMDDASRAQPLLFTIELGIGTSLLRRGLRPAALIGHSVGELVAAVLAGVLDVADAATLFAARSAVMADAPRGGMLAVHGRAAELVSQLAACSSLDEVGIGAINAPDQTMLAGPEPALTKAEFLLRAQGRTCLRVKAHQPFHSTALAPAAVRWRRAFAGVGLRAANLPIRSTRTGEWLRPDEATDPGFWAGQLVEPVLFWRALDGVLTDPAHAEENTVLVETGPGRGLSALAWRHPAVTRRWSRVRVVPLLPMSTSANAWERWCAALDTLGELGLLTEARPDSPTRAGSSR